MPFAFASLGFAVNHEMHWLRILKTLLAGTM